MACVLGCEEVEKWPVCQAVRKWRNGLCVRL